MAWIGKILCWLGWHEWKYVSGSVKQGFFIASYDCKTCNKKSTTLHINRGKL